MARLCGGCDDVFCHYPAVGAIKACSGFATTLQVLTEVLVKNVKEWPGVLKHLLLSFTGLECIQNSLALLQHASRSLLGYVLELIQNASKILHCLVIFG